MAKDFCVSRSLNLNVREFYIASNLTCITRILYGSMESTLMKLFIFKFLCSVSLNVMCQKAAPLLILLIISAVSSS